jgi:hypothetical protein
MRPNNNITIQLTETEIKERQAWFEESRVKSDLLNSQLVAAQREKEVADHERALIGATGVPEDKLLALERWINYRRK